VVLWLSW